MAILRNDSLQVAAPKSVDSRYDNDGSTYANVAAVNAAIISSYRYVGLTVNIGGIEYWYRDGVADGNLIIKTLGNQVSNVIDDTGNNVLLGSSQSGNISLTGNSSDSNSDIIFIPQGTGTLKAAGNHQSNITDDNDIITKGYADANYSTTASVAGSNTQIQFNNSSTFGASSNLTFSSNTLSVNGTTILDGGIGFANATSNNILASNSSSSISIGFGTSPVGESDGAFLSLGGSLSDSIAKLSSGSSGFIVFETEATERLRIDSTGRITTSNYTPSIANLSDIATTGFVDTYMKSFSSATPASNDVLLIKDATDSNNFKYSTIQSIIDLANGTSVVKSGTPTTNGITYWVDANTIASSPFSLDTGNLNMGSAKIVSLADPTANQDAATKSYVDGTVVQERIIVNQSNFSTTLGTTIDSTKEYFIDGVVDTGSTEITVPSTGIVINGYGHGISKLTSSENTYTMFSGATSGNFFCDNVTITVDGTLSQVFDLTAATGDEGIEINYVNFESVTSLGTISGYRQGLETSNGRIGGTPELTLDGAWVGGYRVDTSTAFNMSNFTSLFKAGSSLTIGGRFTLNMNCNLPATGALIDFAPANITNDESLQMDKCFITRSGTINSSDTTIYPNIDETSVKSFWTGCVGIPNTQKYISQSISTEVATTISVVNTYYPLAGTQTVSSDRSHFDSPSNGVLRLLSGNGKCVVKADLIIAGTANDEINIRVVKSTDGGSTFPTVINHIKRSINNSSGGRDVAFLPINFLASLDKDDQIRFEVENTTAARNVTAEIDSTSSIIQV